tara:strand:- start:15949 stop:16539 length:591 start_codon:yes stop_codon:yes gene_type:complete
MKKYYCALGWQHNIPSHLQHFEEVAYSLADKGYTLRTIPTKGASQSFIKGAQRYCKNRRKNIRDYIEVFLPLQSFNGFYSEQQGFYNVQNFKDLERRDRLVKKFSKHTVVREAEMRLINTIPYMVLGEELKIPPSFFITDIIIYDMDSEGNIVDGQGINGQAIRTLKSLSPKTQIFNFDYIEHRQRINSLLYYAKK